MRVAVISSSYDDSASPFKEHDDYDCTPAEFIPEHQCELIKIPKASAVAVTRELVRSGKYDVFVNLCDGAWDEDRAGVEVVEALEHYRAPYTGGAPAFYSLDKQHMKQMVLQAGVGTARFAFCFSLEDLAACVENLTYPLILKHYNGGGSIGTTRESRVTTFEALQKETERFLSLFGGVLIEEFIDGREFTVLVSEGDEDGAEPIAYVPIECSFPPGESFKHFDMKWVEFESISWTPVADAALAERLRDVARRAFTATGGNSYGRCDLRMNDKNEIFFLEINPNCGLYYPRSLWGSADFILDNDPVGARGFTERIINAAFRRFKRTEVMFRLRSHKDNSLGAFATRPIAAQEIIAHNDGTAHMLVTPSDKDVQANPSNYTHVSDKVVMPRKFEMARRQYFAPASETLVANARYSGLNIVALRPIGRNEEIVLDYSTFGTF